MDTTFWWYCYHRARGFWSYPTSELAAEIDLVLGRVLLLILFLISRAVADVGVTAPVIDSIAKDISLEIGEF